MKILFLLFLIVCMGMASKPPIQIELPPVIVKDGDYLTITSCSNCSKDEWDFIQEAVVKTNETVASSCFSSFMLARKLIDTAGFDNKEVVDHLVGKNTVIDVEMYYTLKRVLGYTLEGRDREWINRRYMMSWNKCDLASLLGHETSHKKGFTHSFNYTPSRDYSVPYSINAAFKECCKR